MRIGIKLMVALAGLALTPPAIAQTAAPGAGGGFGHHGMFGGHQGFSPFGMMLKSANLTSAQETQVHQIMESNHTQMHSLMQQMRTVREQIASKLLATSVSPADLAPLQQRLSHTQALIDQDMVDTALQIRNVLTPDQVARLAQLRQQLQGLHQQIESLEGHSSADTSN